LSLNSENQIKSICIFGVGGVGGFFGGKIAYQINKTREKNQEVFFVARGSHLEKIKSDGLVLNTSEKGRMVCNPTLATSKIGDIPGSDLYLICVKSYDLHDTIKSISKRIGENTIIMPLLNGCDIYERIRKNLSNGIVLPACAYVGTHIERPGVVSQRGGEGVILAGRDPAFPDFDPQVMKDFFHQMDIKFRWSDDSFPAIWEKYIFIAAFGLVSVYSGKTMGEVISDHELKELLGKIMMEIVSIAQKKGVKLSEGIVADSIKKAEDFPYETKTSYQRDVESKGELNEGDLFGGTIIRTARALGIETPVTDSIYSQIQQRLISR